MAGNEPYNQSQLGLDALLGGDYSRAREIYGQLLELFPDDIEYECGLYSAVYWDNRALERESTRAGRHRGSYLFREWDEFQKTAEDKDYAGCVTFQTLMRGVLGSAADEFRAAFQAEGGAGADSRLLLDLSICLIRIEDYRNAVEILEYTRRLHRDNARVLFLLGESLASSGEIDAGLAYYRDAFLREHRAADPTLIAAESVADSFKKLYDEKQKDLDLVLEWLPARLFAAQFRRALRPASARETERVHHEAARLARELGVTHEKYREKVRARLAFYLIVLLQEASRPKRDETRVRELEDVLREAAPEIYSEYRAAISGDPPPV